MLSSIVDFVESVYGHYSSNQLRRAADALGNRNEAAMAEFEDFMGWTSAQWTALRMWAERKNFPRPAKPLLVADAKPGDLKTLDAWMRLRVVWLSQHPDDAPPSIGEEIALSSRQRLRQ